MVRILRPPHFVSHLKIAQQWLHFADRLRILILWRGENCNSAAGIYADFFLVQLGRANQDAGICIIFKIPPPVQSSIILPVVLLCIRNQLLTCLGYSEFGITRVMPKK